MKEFKGTKGKLEVGIAGKGETDNIIVKENGKLLTIVDDTGNEIAILGRIGELEHEANAKAFVKVTELLEALQHVLEIMYQCEPPKELHETYANAFMNYNNLLNEILD